MDTKNLASKSDIKDLRTELKSDVNDLKADNKLLHREIIKVEERDENLEEGQKRIEKILSRMENTLDGFVGGVDELRTENTVGIHQTRELQITVEDHEARLKQLESSKAEA